MSNENGKEFKYLGKPRRLVEGAEKVSGHARYTADLTLPGMVYARPILSPYAHAEILSVDKSEAEGMPGVIAVLTAEDLPTRDKLIASRNSAILAKGKVHWRGQPVAVVVAQTEAEAADAVDMVFVDYEPLPAAVDLAASITEGTPLVWPNGLPKPEVDLSAAHSGVDKGEGAEVKLPPNVFDSAVHERGDIEAGFAAADCIVEHRYETPMVHQTYMEPHASVAEPDPLGGGITIYASTQGQYGVRDEVAGLLGLKSSKVRVVPMMFGGGFGAKYGIIDPLVASVAMAVGKPVKMVLSRSEDFATTTPANGMIIHLKTGATNEGKLTAIKATFYVDNGVFAFSIGGIAAVLLGGYYKCDNVHIEVFEVNTNKAGAGAYRAPGAPQATFALESNISDLAQTLGMDELEFRIKNAAQSGDPMGNGAPWPEMGLTQVLETLQAHPAWQNRGKDANEGIGVAIGGWPSFMGPAGALCKVDTDGSVIIQSGAIDVSGVNSTFVLVAAETLGVSPDDVEIVTGDTKSGPFTPNSGGSQITYSVAGAISNAAGEARQKLLEIAAEEFEAAVDDLDIVDGKAHVKGVPDKEIPIGDLVRVSRSRLGGLGPVTGEGTSAVPENAPGFVAHLVKVRVDPETAEITPLQYISVQDVGFAMNPLMVEGQMTGGSIQGLGMGLQERVVYDDSGQLLTGSFMDYDLPRVDTVPTEFESVIVENPSRIGPFGARGIGEPPITAGAAALANAVKDATGVRLYKLPLRAPDLWEALNS